MAYLDATTRLGPGGGPRSQYPGFAAAPATAAITGTADGATEADIVSGGNTIIITLTNDTWVAAGAAFNAQRQNIIDGLDSAQSETFGWNNEVRDKEVVTAVVRTSDTVVTITLTASSAYDITSDEVITVTVPATALVTSASAVVATPTVDIAFVAEAQTGGFISPRRRRRYYVEVDGQDLVARSISEVQSILANAREAAPEAADRDVQTEVVPKPPKIKVKTGAGKATTSKTLQADVKRTQKVINKAYRARANAIAKMREIDKEISQLMRKKIKDEDEDATLALLLM